MSKYLKAVAQVVEDNTKEILPEKFALVFDCWSEDSTHFLAIFARFPSNDAKGFKNILLSFSPFEDETNFSAQSLKEEILFVLARYDIV